MLANVDEERLNDSFSLIVHDTDPPFDNYYMNLVTAAETGHVAPDKFRHSKCHKKLILIVFVIDPC